MISLEYMKGVFQLIGWDGVFLIFVLSIAIISIKDYLKKKKEFKNESTIISNPTPKQ